MSNLLITATELAAELHQYRVFDVRWSLARAGYGVESHRSGHVPGAVFVDLDRDLAAPPGEGRHPLPEPRDFSRTLGRLGLRRGDEVVVYDDGDGGVAARMWWMLDNIGHERVRLLDGGWAAWVGENLPVETGDVRPEPTTYPEPGPFEGVIGHADLGGHLVIDVRAAERYRGDIEPVDPKPGHIPGSLNYPYSDNVDALGRFLGPDALAARFTGLPDDVVVSCGSGVTACQTAFAMRLAGRPMPLIYIGSYSDWSGRDLPVETGHGP